MKVKVCGMRSIENLKQLMLLDIDMVGFIFYSGSKRNVEAEGMDSAALKEIKIIHHGIEKVGVFVNREKDFVLKKVRDYSLDWVQLHGEESFDFCNALKKEGIKVIKAFSIGAEFNFRNLVPYTFFCDYFLFDTKGKLPGGNGFAFNWDLLNQYKEETPFLLSGGLGPDEVEALKKFSHPKWVGIDLNSKFEDSPGIKNIDLLKEFINDFRSGHQPGYWKN